MTKYLSPRRTYWVEGVIVAILLAAVAIGAVILTKGEPITPESLTTAPRRMVAVTTLDGLVVRHEQPLLSLDAISVNGKIFPGNAPLPIAIDPKDSVTVSGWAADRVAGTPASAIFVAVGAQQPVPLQYGGSRPDVAQSLGNSALANTAFVGRLPTKGLPPGPLPLTFYVVASSGSSYDAIATPVSLSVK